jgi:tellurite resistance protein TerA
LTLTKSAPNVSLTKSGATGGVLRVNLRWSVAGGEQPVRRGFLSKLSGAQPQSAIDLDLGCLWEFSDGSKGVVQALGNSFEAGAAGQRVVWLDGDDRSGGGGENLYIDLTHAGLIRRVLVFAYIYDGVPNWAAADGAVTLFPVIGPQVEMRLDEPDPTAKSCAIALLTNDNGEVNVRREVRYIDGAQRALDAAYGWGMNWTPGRK